VADEPAGSRARLFDLPIAFERRLDAVLTDSALPGLLAHPSAAVRSAFQIQNLSSAFRIAGFAADHHCQWSSAYRQLAAVCPVAAQAAVSWVAGPSAVAARRALFADQHSFRTRFAH
jgi:hypothetical protein